MKFKTMSKVLEAYYSRGVWIVFRPYSDVFVEVMSAQDGGVSRQVVEVVHDDSHEQV